MKKYLIIKGASLALIIGGIIASCAKDDVEYVPISVKKTQEYEKVFREVFGEISPNQNWGFSTEVPEEAVEEVEEQASTRTVNCTHTFPSAPSSSAYKSSVPSGVTYLGSISGDVYNKVQSNTAYWVDGNVNYNMDFGRVQNTTLYIKGTVKPTNLYLKGRSVIYVTKGATLAFDKEYSIGTNVTVYVAEGGTLKGSTSKKLQLNSATVYNKGTVTGSWIQLANNSLLYNQNSVTTTGDLTIENAGGHVVNDGTLNVGGNLKTQGSSHFQNNGPTVVKGYTMINSTNNTWVNNDSYTTGDWYYQDGSPNVINNCKLISKNKFCINNGGGANSFKMDANAYTECKYFYAGATMGNLNGNGDVKIDMGANSLFKVTETATMNIQQIGYYQYNNTYQNGIYGPTSGNSRATFQAKVIAQGSNNNYQKFIEYGAKLNVIATSSHFAFWEDGYGNANYQFFLGFTINDVYIAGKNKANKAAPALPTGLCGCGPVITYGVENKVERTIIESGRVFCEDLGQATREDLDFNDVVFDAKVIKVEEVTYTTTYADGKPTGTAVRKVNKTYYENEVVLLAAGGTYNITVDNIDVHSAFGSDVSKVTMVNTRDNNSTAFGDFIVKDPVPLTLNHVYTRIIDIPVVVDYEGDSQTYQSARYKTLESVPGQPPHKFMIPKGDVADPQWPTERKNIGLGYKTFKDWVNNGSTKFWLGATDSYYLYSKLHGTDNDPKGTVVTTVTSTSTIIEETLWNAGQTFTAWSTKGITLVNAGDDFKAGDRLRFNGNAASGATTGEEPHITLVVNNAEPYFLDSKFPKAQTDAQGNPMAVSLEVTLDDDAAARLNNAVNNSQTISLRGMYCTLNSITIIRK